MNTRVQVEHCVTEMSPASTSCSEGIRVAAGEPLSFEPGRRRAARPRDRVPHQRRGRVEELRARARADRRVRRARRPRRARRLGRRAGLARSRRMYDPMVAKLIVWDIDREQATRAHAARAGRVPDHGPQDLIPFHKALLATEQWAAARPAATSSRTASGSRSSPSPRPRRRLRRGRGVDGRADLHGRGLGAALRRQGHRRRRSRRGNGAAPAAPAGRKPPRRERAERGRRRRGGGDTLASPLQGTVLQGRGREGRDRRGGRARRRHRGHEDGERDHRPQGRGRSPSSPSPLAPRWRRATRSRSSSPNSLRHRGTPRSWRSGRKSPRRRNSRALLVRRRRFAVPALLVWTVWFGAFLVCCAFARGFMGSSIYEGFTVGYAWALSVIVLTWIIGWLYVRVSARSFDPRPSARPGPVDARPLRTGPRPASSSPLPRRRSRPGDDRQGPPADRCSAPCSR